ncbi:hypothetical protein LSH36_1333g00017 [Paralvinella palmiformis]|uniref:Cytoplasmic dynein 1 intermediate chain 2 n=1 Tax=Paralvinella palmiformis TaxID=53620 RepID=A0AAD9ITZ9_9ANNE|nr:hypothetical protein LSH36_1333g00017 [Paralvinella palmiformis]
MLFYLPAVESGDTATRPSTLIPCDTTSATATTTKTTSKKNITLTTSQVTQTNIPPKEYIFYSKETQTQPLEKEVLGTEVSSHIRSSVKQAANSQSTGSSRSLTPSCGSILYFANTSALTYVDLDDDNDSFEVAVDTPLTSARHKMPQVEVAKPAQTEVDLAAAKQEEPQPPAVPELTMEEKQALVNRDDFVRFIDRSTRIMERAISENVDIFFDYSGADDEQEDSGLGEGEKLKLNRQFYDERWSKHRIVTSLDWSVQHPELLVASYNNNEDAAHEPDGVALIWNIRYKKTTPEYVFHCQSAVMSSCFAKFHPNLIIGGTYSGQIVLWDNRSNKKTPVQRTPLSAAAHTHPVYCVDMVGTQNAHNLISVSNDGKVCSWGLDMLSQPQDSMELIHKQSRSAAVMCFSFLSGDVNNFVIGTEETAVYTACRHGSKAGISDIFEAHNGPVTGIDCHTIPGQIDFSHYFITSSFDWSVKLWNIKDNKPLHSFEDNNDYVYDTMWSPIHPALFAMLPTANTVIEPNIALNKCRWHQGGHSIAVGDDNGRVHVYDVGETLAQPKSDEWSRFVHTLQDLQTTKADQEEESSFGSSLL